MLSKLPQKKLAVAAASLLAGALLPSLTFGQGYEIRTDPNLQVRIEQFIHSPQTPSAHQQANPKSKLKKAKVKAGVRKDERGERTWR